MMIDMGFLYSLALYKQIKNLENPVSISDNAAIQEPRLFEKLLLWLGNFLKTLFDAARR